MACLGRFSAKISKVCRCDKLALPLPPPMPLLQQHRRAHHVTVSSRAFPIPIPQAICVSVWTVSVTHERYHHGALRDQEIEAGRLSLRQTTEHTDHTLKEKARGATMADEENFSYVCAPWAPVLGFMGCASAIIFASEFRSLRASCWFWRNGAWERSPLQRRSVRSGSVHGPLRRKCTDSYVETSFGKQTVSWREYRSRSIGRALPQFPAHEEQSQWWIELSCGISLSFQLSK